jgi:hypothetical protein
MSDGVTRNRKWYGKRERLLLRLAAGVEVVPFRILAGILRSLGEFFPKIVRQLI